MAAAVARRRVRQRRGASAHDFNGGDVSALPLLVRVLAGNSVTAAAVMTCLNTLDASTLRRLHPAVAAVVAGVPWSDMRTEVRNVLLWRAALPAAVGAKVKRLPLWERSFRAAAGAALAGLTHLDLSDSGDVTGQTLPYLPVSLRALNVRGCPVLEEYGVTFNVEHLTALESLECSVVEDTCPLPLSLRELKISARYHPDSFDIRYLTALRLLTITVTGRFGGDTHADKLPPSLEEVCVSLASDSSLAHLTRLRVLRTSSLDDHTLASLPPCVVELIAAHRYGLTAAASFAHLPGLRVLNVSYCDIGDAALASLPPSLMSLDVSTCTKLTSAAVLPHLPALRVLNVSYSGIGDAALASLPPSLVSLDVSACTKLTSAAMLPHLPALNDVDVSNTAVGGALVSCLPPGLVQLRVQVCLGLARDTSLDHLPALRELQCAGTDLSPDMLVTFRARGCVVPAAGVLRGVGCRVYCLALAPDGRLVGGDSIGAVLLWDAVHGGQATGLFLVDKAYNAQACALATLPNGRLAVGTRRGNVGGVDVLVVGAVSPVKERTIDCGSGVRALAVLANGHLAAGCEDGHVRVLDTGTTTVTDTLKGHTGKVTALAALPDGSLASASADSTVRVWSVVDEGFACVATLTGHTKQVRMLAVLADGRLASGSWDGTVRLWDVGARACVQVLDEVGNVGAMAALPDGRLITGSWVSGTIRVWDVAHPAGTGKSDSTPASMVLARRTGGVRALLPLPGGRLASGHEDKQPHYLWHVPPLASRSTT